MLGVLFWIWGARFEVECSGHGLPWLGWLWAEAATGDLPCNTFMCIIMNQARARFCQCPQPQYQNNIRKAQIPVNALQRRA